MYKSDLEIVVAVDEDGGFGKDGKIPWYYPEDLKHFKEITTGHVCIMGRKTYTDMLEMRRERDKKKKKPTEIKEILPNRQSFVVTSDPDLETPGASKVKSIREAVTSLSIDDPRKIFVIGGERMYREALSWTTKIHLTLVPGTHECDKHFPVDVLHTKFLIIRGDVEGDLKYITYERVQQNGARRKN